MQGHRSGYVDVDSSVPASYLVGGTGYHFDNEAIMGWNLSGRFTRKGVLNAFSKGIRYDQSGK
jgi:hypothetical protein